MPQIMTIQETWCFIFIKSIWLQGPIPLGGWKFVFVRAFPHRVAKTSKGPLCYLFMLVTTNIPIIQAWGFPWNPCRHIFFASVQPPKVHPFWDTGCRFPQPGTSSGPCPHPQDSRDSSPPAAISTHTPFCLQDTHISTVRWVQSFAKARKIGF